MFGRPGRQCGRWGWGEGGERTKNSSLSECRAARAVKGKGGVRDPPSLPIILRKPGGGLKLTPPDPPLS